jgi:protein SCO1/2
MTKAINDLPAEKAAKIQPLFISIDPERDTAEDLKTYVSSFHKDFIGLTGTPEQIKHMADMWKVYYRKVEDDSLNGYTMDHSSYIYLQNAEGQILGLFRMKDSAVEITKYLAKTVD